MNIEQQGGGGGGRGDVRFFCFYFESKRNHSIHLEICEGYEAGEHNYCSILGVWREGRKKKVMKTKHQRRISRQTFDKKGRSDEGQEGGGGGEKWIHNNSKIIGR